MLYDFHIHTRNYSDCSISSAEEMCLRAVEEGLAGIALTEHETGPLLARHEYPCIRCAACLEACPLFLNPSQLGLLAAHQEYERMATDFALDTCFECGSCTFVCPSHIPLVQRFQVAKAALRKARASA